MWGCGQFVSQRLDWQHLCRGGYILNILTVGLMVLDIFFKKVFPVIKLRLWEIYVALATRVQIQSARNTVQSSPYLMVLYMKFDLNWPSDFRVILL